MSLLLDALKQAAQEKKHRDALLATQLSDGDKDEVLIEQDTTQEMTLELDEIVLEESSLMDKSTESEERNTRRE